jgi:hypothetical protein
MRTLLALLRGVNVGKGKLWASCRSSLDGAEWCYSAGAHLTARNGKHIDNNAESLLGRTENTYVPSSVGSVLADRSRYCGSALLAHLQESWLFALAQPANPGAFGQFSLHLLSCVRGMAVGKEDNRCLKAIAV